MPVLEVQPIDLGIWDSLRLRIGRIHSRPRIYRLHFLSRIIQLQGCHGSWKIMLYACLNLQLWVNKGLFLLCHPKLFPLLFYLFAK